MEDWKDPAEKLPFQLPLFLPSARDFSKEGALKTLQASNSINTKKWKVVYYKECRRTGSECCRMNKGNCQRSS